jgi:hypothetical protein
MLGWRCVLLRWRSNLSISQNLFDALQVFFGVYADGVAGGLAYVDGDAVFEQAQLLEALDLLERRGGEGGELLEHGFAVGVEAEVLAVAFETDLVAIKRDGGAGEVEGSAIGCGDDFDGVGVGDVGGGAGDGYGAYLNSISDFWA